MIRDQCILVRADGTVMFDAPAAKARQGVESRDAWHDRTARKAVSEQGRRGVSLVRHERIAPEERPDPKVRDAVRIDRVTGKLSVDLAAARRLLLARYHREATLHMGRLRALAESAAWFDLGAGVESPTVTTWERRLSALESEARRVAGELAKARSVMDLIAIEPQWPRTT